MTINFKEFNKWKKRFIAFLADMFFTVIAWFGANWLATSLILKTINMFFIAKIISIQCLIYVMCGLYRGVWRFASIPDLIRILRAVLIGTMISILFSQLNGFYFSAKVYIINALLLIVTLSGSRLLFRWLRDYRLFFSHGKRILVVGAGSAGEGLIRDLNRSSSIYKYLPVAIADDDPARRGCEVRGVRVLGACHDIPRLVIKYNIELILIAIPSCGSKRMREIVCYCEESNIPFRTLPSIKDIADGIVTVNSLRQVQLEDLLGREQVYLDWGAIEHSIENKTVLVTGGGGSIGSELCRQISQLAPKKLIIIDNNEFNLYSIDMELNKKMDPNKIHAYLCNVTDKIEIEKIFSLHQPELVFHVAAYKHVPLLEQHVRVSMFNNIIGTKTVAKAAEKNNVPLFVLISTDKAVNPTNVMGATKRASEVFCQNLNLYSATRFVTVRFGNVLDSAGSVIPLFRKQLQNGGPLTVTHQDISRYFMTIPEASQLILQATTMQDQGDIFVLDMGEPVNIRYLAEQMIKLSGKIVGQDIEIEFIGLRPGEKLHEELFHQHENSCETSHPKIKQANIRAYDLSKINYLINEIEIACDNNDEQTLREILYQLVPEYKEAHANQTVHQDGKDLYSRYSLSV